MYKYSASSRGFCCMEKCAIPLALVLRRSELLVAASAASAALCAAMAKKLTLTAASSSPSARGGGFQMCVISACIGSTLPCARQSKKTLC